MLANNPLTDIIRRIKKLEDLADKIITFDVPQIVPLAQHIRIIDDTTARAANYQVTLQIAGVGGIPTKTRGVWYSLTLLSTEADLSAAASLVSSDNTLTPTTLAGKGTSGSSVAGAGFTALSSTGTVKFKTLFNVSRYVLDVYAYLR